jgi:hypothetical protein
MLPEIDWGKLTSQGTRQQESDHQDPDFKVQVEKSKARGELLVLARKDKHWTREETGELLDIAPQALFMLEHGLLYGDSANPKNPDRYHHLEELQLLYARVLDLKPDTVEKYVDENFQRFDGSNVEDL